MNKAKIIKQNNKEIKLATGYVDAIISTLREPFLVLDKKLRIISSNRSFYVNFKVTQKETKNQTLSKLGNGQWNIPKLIHLLKDVLRKKTVVMNYEVEHSFERIGRRIMNLNARRLRIPKELAMAITGDKEEEEEELILLAIEDITERRRLEQRLAEAKAKDEAVLASIGDAVMACDKDGRVVLFNRVAETLTGFSVKEAIGKHYKHSIKFVREVDGKPSNDFIAESLKTGQKAYMVNHTFLIRKDGFKIPVADSAAPIRGIDGVLIGCVIVFRDVTHERDVDKAKTEFVSLTSHQLKTPLTAIKWITEMLLNNKKGKLTEEQKGYLDDIRSENEQMIKLINALLDVSRLGLGTFAITPTLVNVNLLLRGIINELKPQIIANKLRLREKYIRQKLETFTDANLLRIILQNLLTNAISYTPEGGRIDVEISSKHKGEIFGKRIVAENSVVFMIADTGCGIPKQQQSKIFTKLFRADNARKVNVHGTGLGLYIIKSIIDKLGGAIWFTSKENKGTTFYVVVPFLGNKAKTEGKQLTS